MAEASERKGANPMGTKEKENFLITSKPQKYVK